MADSSVGAQHQTAQFPTQTLERHLVVMCEDEAAREERQAPLSRVKLCLRKSHCSYLVPEAPCLKPGTAPKTPSPCALLILTQICFNIAFFIL